MNEFMNAWIDSKIVRMNILIFLCAYKKDSGVSFTPSLKQRCIALVVLSQG